MSEKMSGFSHVGDESLPISEVCRLLDAEWLSVPPEDYRVCRIAASDLLSDVLAFTDSATLLLTGLCNMQVVRTAEMMEIPVICFVRGKRPDDNTLELAKEKRIPILATRLTMYEACGRLYEKGLPACRNL